MVRVYHEKFGLLSKVISAMDIYPVSNIDTAEPDTVEERHNRDDNPRHSLRLAVYKYHART